MKKVESKICHIAVKSLKYIDTISKLLDISLKFKSTLGQEHFLGRN